MKTNRSILAITLLAITYSFVFTSCTDDGDTTPPVIILNAPTEGAVLRIGSDIHFDMDLSDNDLLASYKVEIHNAFDGHTHTRSSTGETVAFSFEQTWDVSGLKNTHIHHHEIIVPENATPGQYHLMIYCYDASYNESYLARHIVLARETSETGQDSISEQ